MLRYALRKLLWVIPSVLGISLISFYVLSWVPDPTGSSDQDVGTPLQAQYRQRIRDLPLFINFRPRDIRVRAAEAVDSIVARGSDRRHSLWGERELVRLGGAALPFVLPELDSLAPDARRRLALSLAPLAKRMRLEHRGEPSDPDRAVLFWSRFWETRRLEFRLATVRSAVRRYARYGSEARAEDLRALDTFALPVLIDTLVPPSDRAGVMEARRLVGLLADVTGRDDRIAPQADVASARSCVERWQRWWMLHRADYTPLVGAARVAAFAVETQYGKWVTEAVTMRLGWRASGQPVLGQLGRRVPITLSIVLLALALAYGGAAVFGTVSAWQRKSGLDRSIGTATLLAHLLTPALLAAVVLSLGWPARVGAGGFGKVLVAAVVCALVLLADPMRQQRAALLPVLTQDFVRAAKARGASQARVLFVHALRSALVPVLTRATLEVPMAFTAAFVVEHVLGLPGLGEATIEAVHSGDTAWLMALTVGASIWVVAGLVLTDIAYALVDPRLRQELIKVRRRRA